MDSFAVLWLSLHIEGTTPENKNRIEMKDQLTEAWNQSALTVVKIRSAYVASIDAKNEFATMAILNQMEAAVNLRRALEQLLAAASATK